MFYSKKFRKFKEINHCFFSRKNGFSKGIYKSLNCGRGSRDSKKNIIKNLQFVSEKINVSRRKLILMHQTHSNKVIEINKKNMKKKIIADAIITKERGVALGVVTADCVPILLFDYKNKIVGCIHAGWKGAFSGILKKTIDKFKSLGSSNQIFASIGPCIGYKSYEVDIKFFKKFTNRSIRNKQYFLKKNKKKKLFNLRKFVAHKLIDLDVRVDHVKHDTFIEKNYFFSYRRSSKLEEADYGRCISVISLI